MFAQTTSSVIAKPVSTRSRIFGRFMSVALAAMLVLPAAVATQPAEAGKKFKTITKTISSNGQIDLVDDSPANPYPTTINVDAFKKFKKAKITDVNLTLRNATHTLPDNIDVMLALGNRRATVMSDAGGVNDLNGVTLTLDDQAAADLPNSDAIASGSFRPFNHVGNDPFPAPAPALNDNVALSSFNGLNPDGKWQLFVVDDANNNTGTISGGWELEITAKVKNEKKDKKGKKGKNAKKDDE
jgi:hypothetical protein